MISVRDLNSNDFLTNIRKAWSMQVSDDVKSSFKLLPQKERFELYKKLDNETIKLHREMMIKHREDAIRNGANYIIIDDVKVLEEKYQIDTNVMLIEAGFVVAQTME
ncbi:RNA polymerase binding [Morganella phage vB_MmoM_MP1]|uniref:RNA polymerase binding n=1 Tax=Morganella phage vB_MmoM_MP1 TaxID=1852628 RepID=A0A192YA11_9CAUD|nr:RNA polymerase binding [Morganella phage vB_MmoM_MP1]ANM46559.1 RNA polymerase binding [Morganella phage vB_MmoM_MP1]